VTAAPELSNAPQAIPRTVAAPVAGHRPGSRAYRRTLLGLAAGGLANFSLLYYVQPLLPQVAAHYDVSAGASAQVLSVTTGAMAVALLAVGPVADRFGRVEVMRWSLLASGVLGLASAFAPTWGSLLVLRGLAGVALAGLPAVALAYLREEMHPGAHARANAAYIAGTAVGGAVGRLVPGPLAALGGWTLATEVLGVTTLLAAMALWVLVPRPARFTPRPLRLGSVLTGTASAFRDPVVALLCAVGFASMGTFVGVYNAVAFRLEAPPFSLGHAVTLVYLAYPVGIVTPSVAQLLARRRGRGTAVVVGLLLLAAGVALTAPPVVTTVVVGLGVLTVGFFCAHSLVSGWAVDRAHRQDRGTAQASSAYLFAYYVGSAVMGAVTTHVWEDAGWSGVIVVSTATTALAVAAASVAARLDRGQRGLVAER